MGEKKRSGIDYQHPEAYILGPAVEFIGNVPTEHARPDDYDIKWVASIVIDFGPAAAPSGRGRRERTRSAGHRRERSDQG